MNNMTNIAFDKLTVEDRSVLAQASGMLSIFEDPISFEIMEKAMMTPCGHSFSETSIGGWLHTNNHCPLCNKTLRRNEILPNYALRTAIARFVTAQKHLQQSIQSTTLSVGVSSECYASQQLNMDDWKVIRVEQNEFEGELTTDSKVLVELIGGRDLKADWFGYINPYCVLEFSDQRKKSKVVHHNTSPKWEETFVFNIPNVHSEEHIVLTLWDKDRILKDRFLGMVSIPLPEVVTTLKMVRRFPLQKKRPDSRKRVRGDVLLRVQFLDLRKSYEVGKSERSITAVGSRSPPPSPASSVRQSSPPHSPISNLPPLPPVPQLPQPQPQPLVQLQPQQPLEQQPLEQQPPPLQLEPPAPPQPVQPPQPPEHHVQEPLMGLIVEPQNVRSLQAQNQNVQQHSSLARRSRPPPPLPPPRRGSAWVRAEISDHDSYSAASSSSSSSANGNNRMRDPPAPHSPHPHRRKPSYASSPEMDSASASDAGHTRDHDGADINSSESTDSTYESVYHEHDTENNDIDHNDEESQRQLWEAMGVLHMQIVQQHDEMMQQELEEALENKSRNEEKGIYDEDNGQSDPIDVNLGASQPAGDELEELDDIIINDNVVVDEDDGEVEEILQQRRIRRSSNTNNNNDDTYENAGSADVISRPVGDRLSPFVMPPPPPPPAPPADLVLPVESARPMYLDVMISEDDVKSLVEMGFQESLVRFALKYCDNDVETALDRLLNHTDALQLSFLKSLFY